jgi:uncharacterized repeat protein (TIGR03803 family)
MTKFSWMAKACGVSLLWATVALALPAQTLTTLHNFVDTDGANPIAGLVQGTDGNLYGTTEDGEANNGGGTVFKITANGTLTTLDSFDFTDGYLPQGELVQATNGDFYGTTYETYEGGDNSDGTVFKITANGMLTTLHSFDGTDGANPYAGLVQSTDGSFYGTAFDGGASGYGTVFKITPGGTLTTLHSFDGTDGEYPAAGLVQGTDGDFYGATYVGRANDGTIFKITPGGTLTTLHSFDGTDGANPLAGLIDATNGDFYGTTQTGGASNACASGCGTIFKITPGGTLTTLHSFDGTDGANPAGGLVQATNGDFYGTTEDGGASNACPTGCGTLFEITTSGTLTTLDSFDGTDGANPTAGLVQATNGKFYGTTSTFGANGYGTVFSLSVGLGPFVETQPTSGPVGGTVKILGTDLTGASSVTFNGTAAVFTVESHSLITATVPTGATTGTVQVVTSSGGTLSSNVPFRVN